MLFTKKCIVSIFLTTFIVFFTSISSYAAVPTFTEGSSTTRAIDENTASGTNIGNPISATDADGDTLIYTLEGADKDSFSINSTTGQLQTNAALNHEADDTYTVTVSVADGNGGTNSIDVTINVTDVNEAPIFRPSGRVTLSVAENAAWRTNIGAPFQATDPDSGDTVTYSLQRGDKDAFRIDANTGQLRTHGALDYETKSSYTDLAVRATDSQGLSNSVVVIINVTNVLDISPPLNARTWQIRDAIIAAVPGANNVNDVTPAQIAAITELNFSDFPDPDRPIYTMKAGDFNDLIALTTLNLEGNEISDLSPLRNLTSLTRLDLSDNEITDISALEDLTSLTVLSLRHNQISNLSPLRNLTSLTDIDLYNNKVTNLSPLRNLTSLTRLVLNGNQISNVAPLRNLTSLIALGLWNNQITDISPLATLASLQHLLLNRNSITDLSPLEDMTSLIRLTLQHNPIEDYAPLRRLLAAIVIIPGRPGLTLDIPIPVVPGNNAPQFSDGASATRSITNNAAGINIGTPVAATDQNTADRLTYHLGGTDAGWFHIVKASGQLQTNVVLDETKSSYAVTVAVSDGNGGMDTISVTINLPGASEICQVGGVLAAGQSCTYPGTDTEFSVNSNGTGQFLFFSSGSRLNIRDTQINNVSYTLVAEKLNSGSWEIKELGATAPPPTTNGINPPLSDRTPAVRDAIVAAVPGVSNADDVTPAQLAAITSLDLSSALKAGDFNGLTGLTTLDLRKNTPPLSDLSPLADLTSLTHLYLNLNFISDLTPLAGLTKLTVLSLQSNRVSDISPLRHLTALEGLDLHGNSITELSPLKNLTSLKNLILTHNEITDVSTLEYLTSLRNLYLNNNPPIEDYAPLRRLKTVIAVIEGHPGLYLDIPIPTVSNPNVPVFREGTSTTRSIAENTAADTDIGTPVAARDADGDRLTYTFGGTDKDAFSIARTTGQLRTSAALDYETKQSYSVTVTASDGKGGSASITVTIDITDVPEIGTPVANDGICRVGDVLAAGESCTYSGTDTEFSVSSNGNGQFLFFSSSSSLNIRDTQINNVSYTLVAEKLSSGSWQIKELGATAPPPTTNVPAVTEITPALSDRTPAVRDAIVAAVPGVSNANDVTVAQLAAITSLDLSRKSIWVLKTGDFNGLTGLTTLDLRNNRQLSDISPLAGLTSLTELRLNLNWISDLSPLAGLTNLTTLSLQANRVTDITPLRHLTALEGLDLFGNRDQHGNSLTNIEPLRNLTSLKVLILVNNSITNVSALEGLTSLRRLSLSGNSISDYAPLRRLQAAIAAIPGHPGLTIDIPIPTVSNPNTPVFSDGASTTRSVAENTASGTNIGTPVAATDADGDRLTYTLVGTGADSFSIVRTTGQLKTKDALDYETLSAYSVTVSVSDSKGGSASISVTINITDVPEIGTPVANDGICRVGNVLAAGESCTYPGTQTAFSVTGNGNGQFLFFSSGSRLNIRNTQINNVSYTLAAEKLNSGSWQIKELGATAAPPPTTNVINPPLSTRTPAVRAAIVAAVPGVSNANDVTVAHLAAITRLDLSGRSISALKTGDFNGLTGLTWLNLYNNQVSDISALSNLTSLTWLELSNNQISDISVLSNLTSLRSLALGWNRITNVSALEGLTSLRSLTVIRNPFSDYAPLRRLQAAIDAIPGHPGLTVDPPIPPLTVSPPLSDRTAQVRDAIVAAVPGVSNADDVTVEHLAAITTLILGSKSISALKTGDFNNLTGLTSLYLNNNSISNISALSNLTSLTYLALNSNSISTISALEDLTSLEELWLSGNSISDISALEDLTSLEELYLNSNSISDISALEDLTSLTLLRLALNQISDISVLENLTALTWLGLDYNSISDVSALEGLTSLTELRLTNNSSISDVSALEGLTSLTLLKLANTSISDYAPLRRLQAAIAAIQGPPGLDLDITIPAVANNNAPVFSDGDSTTRSVAENTASGTNIGTAVAATDADTGNTLSYYLSGTDASSFSIVRTTGQLQTSAALNYETKSSYAVSVSVSDGNGGRDSISVTINVTDVATENSAPAFTEGSSTTRSIEENTAAGVNIGTAVAATDADNDTLTYTLRGTDKDSFSIVSTTGQLQTKAALNAATKATYTVFITVSDSTSSATITVTINVTEIPDIAGGICQVGGVLAAGESCTYAGTDTEFSIDSNGNGRFLFFSSGSRFNIRDIQINNTPYTLVAEKLNSGSWEIKELGATAPPPTPNTAPVFTDGASTTRSVAENTDSGVDIGSAVSATDADNDTLTYTLGGTDASSFTIDSASGQIRTRAALDYETKSSYAVSVSVDDGNGGSGSITVTINVTDVITGDIINTAPAFTDGTSTTRSIDENTASGANIGSPIAATDADDHTLTYTLGGTDATSFTIVSTTGQLQTSAALDYETKSSYAVTVTVDDGNNGSASISVTINVTDVNEVAGNNAPAFSGTSTTRTIIENIASSQNIGSPIAATDADTGDTLTYTLGGTDASSFTIVSTSGQLQTRTALDYETKPSYAVSVFVSDGNGGSDSIAVTINVTNVNEAPSFSTSGRVTLSVVENTASGTDIGAPFQATDPDSGDTVTYSLERADKDSFSIDANTGQLKTSAALDYETKKSYSNLAVRATDNHDFFNSVLVTVNVTDVVNEPTPVNKRTQQVQAAIVAAINGVNSADDVTPTQLAGITTLNLDRKGITSLKSGDFDGLTGLTTLHLSGNTGLSALPSDVFDELTALTTLRVSGNNLRALPSDVFDELTALTTLHVSHNSSLSALPSGIFDELTALTTLNLAYNNISDVSELEDLTSLTKLYLLRNPTISDYDPLRKLVAAIEAAGGSLQIDIPIPNAIPAFTEGTSTTRAVTENTAAGTNIGTAVSATDADNDTLTYTLGGTDKDSFSIVSTTGQLQTKVALDYETTTSYSVTVSVSDGNRGSDSIAVTINVTNVNEGVPTFTDGTSTTRSVAENTAAGVNIGTAVAATDADNDTLTYTLGGTDASSFSIDSTTGQLQTKDALDYDTKPSYSVTVSVDDGNGGSATIAVTISVTEVIIVPDNNAPEFTDGTSTTRSIAENTAAGVNIGTAVAATDDDGDTLTYTLSGTDASSFSIVGTTGQLQTSAKLDYEATKNSYSVTVTVDDSKGGSATITVTINVTDEPEPAISARTATVKDAIVAAVPNVSDADNVTVAHLAAITSVDLSSKSISTLKATDFNGLTGLTTLNLSTNSITDVSPFTGLTTLTTLNLSTNSISDISDLDDLINLTNLNLSTNSISGDIPDLSGLTKLTNLNLSDNAISGISELADLSTLTTLDLSNSSISLDKNSISDVSALSGLTALTSLKLARNPILSYVPLRTLKKASSVNIDIDDANNNIDTNNPPVLKNKNDVLVTEITYELSTLAPSGADIHHTGFPQGFPATDGDNDSLTYTLITEGAAATLFTFNSTSRKLKLKDAWPPTDPEDPYTMSLRISEVSRTTVFTVVTITVTILGTNDGGAGNAPPSVETLPVLPETTALLTNYPNPFNPETWIPYQLAKPAEVTLTIYDIRGRVVRTLRLGHQPAGFYQNRSKAAHWDGHNHLGEKVATGVYFYTLKAGDYTATRKLLIRK